MFLCVSFMLWYQQKSSQLLKSIHTRNFLLVLLIILIIGHTEPVHQVNFYKSQIVSATTNNKIGVHTSVDQQVGVFVYIETSS